MDRDNTHRKDYNMDLNKAIRKVLPLRKEVVVTVRLDLMHSYKQFFKDLPAELDKVSEKDLTKYGKVMEKSFKRVFELVDKRMGK